MQRQPIHSVSIQSAGYTPDTGTLEVEFLHSGAIYAYFGVPESIYRAFLQARSKGRYFNRRIRDQFKFERVG